jgi:CelD/BcsL family acetyltransferase involved in cellulose biosynthesis
VSNWDVLQLSDMTDDSLFMFELSKQSAERKLTINQQTAANIAYIRLPESWDDYLTSLHRDRRNTIRRTRRKVETQHAGRFFVRSGETDCDETLDHLIRLHHKRWKGHPDGHAFSTPQYVGFHRAVVSACAKRHWIRFYCLEADGEIVAVFYCYRFRNQIFYFQAGFDPDRERLRPGLVLIGLAVENAILEGNDVFDFLRGEHAYKNQWGKSVRETKTFVVYRPQFAAAMFHIRTQRLPVLKAWIKSAIPFLRPKPHGGRPHDGSGD